MAGMALALPKMITFSYFFYYNSKPKNQTIFGYFQNFQQVSHVGPFSVHQQGVLFLRVEWLGINLAASPKCGSDLGSEMRRPVLTLCPKSPPTVPQSPSNGQILC